MIDKIYMTEQGKLEAENKLESKREEMKQIVERLKEARAQGDLSENAEYDAAKTEQAICAGEIAELEGQLKLVEIIKKSDKDVIGLGSVVEVYDEEYDEKIVYTIVGSAEADIKSNKISNESPVGKGLLGKKKGDIADIDAPQGIIKLKVLSVK